MCYNIKIQAKKFAEKACAETMENKFLQKDWLRVCNSILVRYGINLTGALLRRLSGSFCNK